MTLDDALGTYDWLPDGWVLASAEHNGWKCVGVWNGVKGRGSRRHAVRIPVETDIEDAFPILLDWIERPIVNRHELT